jgi:hypothetical protein
MVMRSSSVSRAFEPDALGRLEVIAVRHEIVDQRVVPETLRLDHESIALPVPLGDGYCPADERVVLGTAGAISSRGLSLRLESGRPDPLAAASDSTRTETPTHPGRCQMRKRSGVSISRGNPGDAHRAVAKSYSS